MILEKETMKVKFFLKHFKQVVKFLIKMVKAHKGVDLIFHAMDLL